MKPSAPTSRSAGIFGSEMHSPIMALGNGIPAIVCRFAEQTSKGIMWRDIGLGDWLFDFDDEGDIERVVPTILAFAKDPAAAKAKAATARAFVQRPPTRNNGRAAKGSQHPIALAKHKK